MARLLHLNGPPRVGKSTLARRYGDEHPGVLVLDVDVLVGLVGGWRDDFSSAHDVAVGLAWTLARHHLRAGRDVVYPQLLTVHDTGPHIEGAAREAGAGYLEVVLLVDRDEHRARLAANDAAGDVGRAIQSALERPGSDLLERIDGHLGQYVAGRPGIRSLDTTGLDEDRSYAELCRLLDPPDAGASPGHD